MLPLLIGIVALALIVIAFLEWERIKIPAASREVLKISP
jgi:hypothetical protein